MSSASPFVSPRCTRSLGLRSRIIERCSLLLCAALATACAADGEDNDPTSERQEVRPSTNLVVTTFASATFIPFDPANPSGGGYAVLSGDPEQGPSQMLFKYGPGPGAMHQHSSNYQAVVIQGEAIHWPEGTSAADAARLGPGSYWSQPALQQHADECLTSECLLFITWDGRMD
jgi:hypothetical protein